MKYIFSLVTFLPQTYTLVLLITLFYKTNIFVSKTSFFSLTSKKIDFVLKKKQPTSAPHPNFVNETLVEIKVTPCFKVPHCIPSCIIFHPCVSNIAIQTAYKQIFEILYKKPRITYLRHNFHLFCTYFCCFLRCHCWMLRDSHRWFVLPMCLPPPLQTPPPPTHAQLQGHEL